MLIGVDPLKSCPEPHHEWRLKRARPLVQNSSRASTRPMRSLRAQLVRGLLAGCALGGALAARHRPTPTAAELAAAQAAIAAGTAISVGGSTLDVADAIQGVPAGLGSPWWAATGAKGSAPVTFGARALASVDSLKLLKFLSGADLSRKSAPLTHTHSGWSHLFNDAAAEALCAVGGEGALFYACADPEGALHYVAPGKGCSVPSAGALPEVCGWGTAALKVRAVLRAPALTALLSGAVGELQGALGEVAPGAGGSPPTYPEADSVRRAAARSRLDEWPDSNPRLQLSFDVIVPERVASEGSSDEEWDADEDESGGSAKERRSLYIKNHLNRALFNERLGYIS